MEKKWHSKIGHTLNKPNKSKSLQTQERKEIDKVIEPTNQPISHTIFHQGLKWGV